MKIIHPNTAELFNRLDGIRKDLTDFGFDSLMPIPLVIDRIIRGELILVASEHSYILGQSYVDGLDKTFFIFWCDGKKAHLDIPTLMLFLKTNFQCKKVVFRSNSEAHNKLYNRLFRAYNPHKSCIFSMDV